MGCRGVGLQTKVAAQLRCSGNIRAVQGGFAVAPAVVTTRKEGLILDDGTGKGRSELVLSKWKNLGRSCDWVEIRHTIARIECIVTHVFEGRTMEGSASRRGNHVHDATCCATKFSFGVVPNHLELLDQINVRNHNICWSAYVCIDDAVKKVELRAVLLSVERSIRETRPGDSDVSFAASNALVLGGGNGRDTWS